MSQKESLAKMTLVPWLAGGIAIGLIVIGGALYGNYSQRWGPPADLLAMGQAVDTMPDKIGDWNKIDETRMEKSVLEMLECAGYVNRQYQHRSTGQIVNVAVLVGPPGPIAVHTPEICFSSRAYEQRSIRERLEMKAQLAGVHSFWRLDFDTKNMLANRLRVYYAWSIGPRWIAADAPRYEFAAGPALYKLQLATEIPAGNFEENREAGEMFLQALIDSNWRLGPSGETSTQP